MSKMPQIDYECEEWNKLRQGHADYLPKNDGQPIGVRCRKLPPKKHLKKAATAIDDSKVTEDNAASVDLLIRITGAPASKVCTEFIEGTNGRKKVTGVKMNEADTLASFALIFESVDVALEYKTFWQNNHPEGDFDMHCREINKDVVDFFKYKKQTPTKKRKYARKQRTEAKGKAKLKAPGSAEQRAEAEAKAKAKAPETAVKMANDLDTESETDEASDSKIAAVANDDLDDDKQIPHEIEKLSKARRTATTKPAPKAAPTHNASHDATRMQQANGATLEDSQRTATATQQLIDQDNDATITGQAAQFGAHANGERSTFTHPPHALPPVMHHQRTAQGSTMVPTENVDRNETFYRPAPYNGGYAHHRGHFDDYGPQGTVSHPPPPERAQYEFRSEMREYGSPPGSLGPSLVDRHPHRLTDHGYYDDNEHARLPPPRSLSYTSPGRRREGDGRYDTRYAGDRPRYRDGYGPPNHYDTHGRY